MSSSFSPDCDRSLMDREATAVAFGLACLGSLSLGTEISDVTHQLLKDCLYLEPKQPGSPSSMRDIAIRAWSLAIVSEGGLMEADWTRVKAEISRRYGFSLGGIGAEPDDIALVFLLHAAMLSCGTRCGNLRGGEFGFARSSWFILSGCDSIMTANLCISTFMDFVHS